MTSIQVVAGSMIVTPARIRSRLTRSRSTARSAASSARSLQPNASVASGARCPTTGSPAATSRASTSVRYSSPWSLRVDSFPSNSRSADASNAYAPALISRIARSSADASRSSTIARSRPSSPRTIRPSPRGSGTSAVSTLAAAPARSCSSTSWRSVSARTSGMSPFSTTTVPATSPSSSIAMRTACPVPRCSACRAVRAAGATSARCSRTLSAPRPTTTTVGASPSPSAAATSTWPSRVRPSNGCRTFGNEDFMRLPSPAASTTTVRGLATELTRDSSARTAGSGSS